MSPIWTVLVAAVGALLGPVLRARIFRYAVPPERPWRHACPLCDRVVAAPGRRGLVAVLPPTGRCPGCAGRVGPPPFTVEAVTAVIFAALAASVDRPLPLAAFCWLAAVGAALGFVDVAVHRLPDRLTMTGYAGVLALLGAAALAERQPARVGSAALTGLGMAAFYLVLVLVNPAGMGLGDAKLALSVGTALGWYGWVLAVFAVATGFLFAALFSIVLMGLGRATRKTQVPHGPFMLLGALVPVAVLL